MFARSSYLRFILLAGLTFGVLVVPRAGVERAYAACFRGVGEVVTSILWFGSPARFERHRCAGFERVGGTTCPSCNKDTQISVQQAPTQDIWTVTLQSRYVGWIPTATFLALLAATPLPWRRRWRAFLWGGLWVNLYVVLRLVLSLFEGLTRYVNANGSSAMRSGLWGAAWWEDTLDRAVAVVNVEPTFYVLVPLVIWLGVTFRWSDMQALINRRTASPSLAETGHSARLAR